MPHQLTDREADIMNVLWELGPSTVAEVRAALKSRFAHTTVQTMLRILESKGFVAHQEEGRQHRFRPLVQEGTARQSALKHLLAKMFRGSSELLLTQLVSDQKLTAEQVRRMRKLLSKKE
ncbi:MAG TPA: BlaI/MecI/CopY family transcriptional regulator [Steroidobacteraceae bacterium]|jgi:BlaI family penicillinase repressor|nr:BlaI/MecI/CopY family transcriptional regulator [Steroidobacteraceae bacterium]